MSEAALHIVTVLIFGFLASACGLPQEQDLAPVRQEIGAGAEVRFENVVRTASPRRICGWVATKRADDTFGQAEKFVVQDGVVIMLADRIEPGAISAFGECVAMDREASRRMLAEFNQVVRSQ